MIIHHFIYLTVAAFALQSCVSVPVSSRSPLAPRAASSSMQLSRPALKRLPNGHYRVTKPWTLTAGGRVWTVQRGYTSNGITAPAALRARLGDGVGKPETWSAVFHDWLFTQKGVSRSTADELFYEVMLGYGISPNRAKMMYSTVRSYSLYKYGL